MASEITHVLWTVLGKLNLVCRRASPSSEKFVKVSLHQDKVKRKLFVSLSIFCLENRCVFRPGMTPASHPKVPQQVKLSSSASQTVQCR